MNLVYVIVFNLVFGALLLINLIYMLFKFFRDISLEQTSYVGQEDTKNKDYSETFCDPVIHEQMGLVRKKFYINFILVEISLITLFIFWGIIFFYKLPIT